MSALSYFSRLTSSSSFGELATLEIHRRGVETAGRVGAVVDGAEWCQTFIDLHAPQAVRILDFPHAAEYIEAIGQTAGADGPLLVAATPQESVPRSQAQRRDECAGARAAYRRRSRLSSRDGHAGSISGEAARADGLSTLPRRAVADWEWDGGKRQQTGGRGADERAGHALGGSERESDTGVAQCDLQ